MKYGPIFDATLRVGANFPISASVALADTRYASPSLLALVKIDFLRHPIRSVNRP
jgi:hypothetical protein